MKKIFTLIVCVGFLSSCASVRSSKKHNSLDSEKDNPMSADSAPTPPTEDVSEASLRDGGFTKRDDLQSVPFDYDSAKLSDEALSILKSNASILKEEPGTEVLVSGNCDERGTVAYNLALGQKRAKEVREYYVRLGVEGNRIATISYGKERPLCNESSEECWSQNRRAETRARQKK